MLKIVRISLSLMVMAIGIYGLTTHNSALLPYEMSLLGIIIVIYGISELLKKRKGIGIFYIFVAAFVLYVVIQTTVFR
jgi:hypothetical protein